MSPIALAEAVPQSFCALGALSPCLSRTPGRTGAPRYNPVGNDYIPIEGTTVLGLLTLLPAVHAAGARAAGPCSPWMPPLAAKTPPTSPWTPPLILPELPAAAEPERHHPLELDAAAELDAAGLRDRTLMELPGAPLSPHAPPACARLGRRRRTCSRRAGRR